MPRGMVKRTGMAKAGPEKPPPSIGDLVWYRDKKDAWRTGRLLRVIDSGKFWGKLEVQPNNAKTPVPVTAEQVRAL